MAKVKFFQKKVKSQGQGHEVKKTDRKTDRVISIYPPPQKKNFVCGGYKNEKLCIIV